MSIVIEKPTDNYNGQLSIWNAQTHTPVGSSIPLPDVVWSLSFSRDGAHLAAASDNNEALVWGIQARRHRIDSQYVLKHSGHVYYVAFSPDGTRIVTASQDHTARIGH